MNKFLKVTSVLATLVFVQSNAQAPKPNLSDNPESNQPNSEPQTDRLGGDSQANPKLKSKGKKVKYEWKYGNPEESQKEYNTNGLWPYYSDPPTTGIILTLFFLIWNSIMSALMTNAVLAPISRGRFEAHMCLLCVFPHWYVGIILPFALGGIIPGIAVTFFPWFFAIVCSARLGAFGCSEGQKENTDDPTGQDASGNVIHTGDIVMMKVTTTRKKKPTVITWPKVELLKKRKNGKWDIQYVDSGKIEDQIEQHRFNVIVEPADEEEVEAEVEEEVEVQVQGNIEMNPISAPDGLQMGQVPSGKEQPAGDIAMGQPIMYDPNQAQGYYQPPPMQPMQQQYPGMIAQPVMQQPMQQQMMVQTQIMQPVQMVPVQVQAPVYLQAYSQGAPQAQESQGNDEESRI